MPAISIITLHDPVAIVHIPIIHPADYSSKLYWTIDRAASSSSEFFNVTSNRIEIAIFASEQLVFDEWNVAAENDPEVRISPSWRVFEISSGDIGETGNYDSPHLRCVSAPLARAGISILYQSSYFTDFLLVKEEDFETAARIFVSQGYSATSSPRRHSTNLTTPSPPLLPSPIFPTPNTTSSLHIPSSPEITVLSSPLACVGLPKSTEKIYGERLRRYLVWPERCLTEWEREAELVNESERFGEDSVIICNSKIKNDGRPFISYTRTGDEASIMTELKALRFLFPNGGEEEGIQSAGDLWNDEEGEDEIWEEDSDCSSEDGDMNEAFRVMTSDRCGTKRPLSTTSTTGIIQVTEDGPGNLQNDQTVPLSEHVPNQPRIHTRSQTKHCHVNTLPIAKQPAKHTKRLSLPATPSTEKIQIFWSDPNPHTSNAIGYGYGHGHGNGNGSRTSLSLSGSIHRPNDEEDRINDQGLFFEARSNRTRSISPTTTLYSGTSYGFIHEKGMNVEISGGEDDGKARGRKRCLQLDLRGVGEGMVQGKEQCGAGVYHLDKSGLVTLFSDLLDSAHIRMLYSSTYHTANVLVQAGDIGRAKRLLAGGGKQ